MTVKQGLVPRQGGRDVLDATCKDCAAKSLTPSTWLVAVIWSNLKFHAPSHAHHFRSRVTGSCQSKAAASLLGLGICPPAVEIGDRFARALREDYGAPAQEEVHEVVSSSTSFAE